MNELEKEIRKSAEYHKGQNSAWNSYMNGAQFILDKNLMAKFCRWVHKNIIVCSWSIDGVDGEFCFCFNDSLSEFECIAIRHEQIICFTYEDLEQFWINNVYGK
jgi:hypothetical protein